MATMENFTMSDLGIFCTTLASAIVLICGAIQKSKCSKIKMCPPTCIRDPKIKTDPNQMTPRLPNRDSPVSA
jgi:hypothetical protein